MRTTIPILTALCLLTLAALPAASAEPGGDCGSFTEEQRLPVDVDCDSPIWGHCAVWLAFHEACILPSSGLP